MKSEVNSSREEPSSSAIRIVTPFAANATDSLPEQEISQVFTRFYRASNASSAAVPGSGLGLAIAHDIVNRHGGSLDLTSVLGSGTTVSVHLPLTGP